ncbi:MAG: hypothetical protein KJ556_20000, partial [Gammaproteobacteria bacterium]|nr:hypothetical protein [Gammaproteobacteria bacterium]
MNLFKRSKAKESKSETVIDGQKVPDVVHWAKSLLDEATDGRRWGYDIEREEVTFREAMRRRLLQYLGQQWELRDDVVSDEDMSVENYLFTVVESQLPIMLATRPEVTFRPEGVEDVEMVDALDKVVSKEMDKADYDSFLALWAKACKIFGWSVGFCGYTYLKNPPAGMHEFRVCDPLGILWEQDESTIEDSKYLIEVRMRRKTDVEEEFMVEIPEQDLWGDFQSYDLVRYMRGLYPKRIEEGLIPKVLQIDIWYRDSTKEESRTPVMEQRPTMAMGLDGVEVPAQDEMGNPVMEEVQATDEEGNLLFDVERVPKYPGGRRIVLTGSHLLYDGPNPYEHGLFPYAKIVNYDIPGHFIGMSEFQQLENAQDDINEVLTQMKVNSRLTGNNQREVVESRLADNFTKDDITNQPGLNIPVLEGQGPAIRNIQQGEISSQAMALYQARIKAIETISGSSEVSRGIAKASDSGIKVQSLDQYTSRRLQRPTWNIERAVVKMGRMMLGNIKQFIPETTIWRIATDEGETKMTKGELPLDIEYDVRVTPMSSLPSDRDAKLQMLIAIKQVAPEIPSQILFKYMDIPELAEAYKEWEDEKEQMQMQLAQAQEALARMEGGGGTPQ